jgi:hypothetical protein
MTTSALASKLCLTDCIDVSLRPGISESHASSMAETLWA